MTPANARLAWTHFARYKWTVECILDSFAHDRAFDQLMVVIIGYQLNIANNISIDDTISVNLSKNR